MFKSETFVPHFEWHSYDRGELHFYIWGHRASWEATENGIVRHIFCSYCSADLLDEERKEFEPFQGNICDVEVTDEYYNFFRNMLAVISLAAIRQRTEEEIKARLEKEKE